MKDNLLKLNQVAKYVVKSLSVEKDTSMGAEAFALDSINSGMLNEKWRSPPRGVVATGSDRFDADYLYVHL